ncbi:hypothetical protein ACO0LL_18935 [Undibacterium sp. TC4M20W]|uniref:hypothetical protein n=1 Tax=Undibacterium sp. TC4M20W TaxID=3413052 RepID=UPI003BF3EA1F
MSPVFHFSFESHWRSAPLAYWVHLPVAGQPDSFLPAAPPCILHRGYAVLHVEFEQFDLVFSAPAQLDHFIAVLSTKPLPTSGQLSALRKAPIGPNGHWLSRLPAALKAPRKRGRLVRLISEIRSLVVDKEKPDRFDWKNHDIA